MHRLMGAVSARTVRMACCLVGIAGLGILVAACGGSSSSSTDSSTAASEAETGQTQTTASNQEKATGTPIKVLTQASVDWVGESFQENFDAAEMYAQYINDRGGINGHPLEVITCDDKGDPNQSVACARKGANEAVANVGSISFYSAQVVPLLQKLGQAWMPAVATSVADLTSPVSFQTSSNGLIGSLTGAMVKAQLAGCKNVAVVQEEGTFLEQIKEQSEALSKALGYNLKQFVAIPVTSTDFSGQAAQATDGTDCIVLSITSDSVQAMMPALAQAGADQTLIGYAGNLDLEAVKGFEELAEGAYQSTAFPPENTFNWPEFYAAQEQYGIGTQAGNPDESRGVWEAMATFTEIAKTIKGPIDSATFLKAASTARVDPGLGVAFDFAKPGPGAFTRAFNTDVWYRVFENGEVVPESAKPTDLAPVIEEIAPAS